MKLSSRLGHFAAVLLRAGNPRPACSIPQPRKPVSDRPRLLNEGNMAQPEDWIKSGEPGDAEEGLSKPLVAKRSGQAEPTKLA